MPSSPLRDLGPQKAVTSTSKFYVFGKVLHGKQKLKIHVKFILIELPCNLDLELPQPAT